MHQITFARSRSCMFSAPTTCCLITTSIWLMLCAHYLHRFRRKRIRVMLRGLRDIIALTG